MKEVAALSIHSALSPSTSLIEFCPKKSLHRLKNLITSWIPVWRKSQIFRLHLTDVFGPFTLWIRTFGKLQSCSPFKLNFHPNLNHLDWTFELKVMPKILTDVQVGILIRIGLGFGANFLWFLTPIGLKFN